MCGPCSSQNTDDNRRKERKMMGNRGERRGGKRKKGRRMEKRGGERRGGKGKEEIEGKGGNKN